MISYIVAVYREEQFEDFCLPALLQQEAIYGAEIVAIEGAESIYAAYEEGRQRAKNTTRVYLHDDVALMDLDATPRIFDQMKRADAALMGAIGATGDALPWWRNDHIYGGWCSMRRDMRLWWNYGLGTSTPCEEWNGTQRPIHPRPSHIEFDRSVDLLDGILLAERYNGAWPARPAGWWHGYDAERCSQARAAGGWVGILDLVVCHWQLPKDDPATMEKHEDIMREIRGAA